MCAKRCGLEQLEPVTASQKARPPLHQDAASQEPPPSSLLSGWLALGVATPRAHRPIDQEDRYWTCGTSAVSCTF